MTDSNSRVVIQFVGQDSGLNSTVTSLSEQFARLEASGKGLASVLAQASETAQKFGSAGSQSATGAEKLGAAATSASRGAEQLAKSLNLNFQAAQQFANGLGLAEGKAAQAVAKLQALNSTGATVQTRFEVLSKELGVNAQQFLKLDGAVTAQNERLAQLRVQTEQATIAQQNQAAASKQQAVAAAGTQQGLIGLGLAAGGLATAIGGVFVKGTKDFIQFDDAIKQAGITTQTTGTPALGALRQEVERLGIVTSKSPAEVAALAQALAKTSLTAPEVKSSLEGIIRASEGTGESLLGVGNVIGQTLTQFKLNASETGKVGDLLVATAQNSNTSLGALGDGLKKAGPVAAQSNQSLRDTVFVLGLLANSGIRGGEAGTAYAAVLDRLKVASAASGSELTNLVRGSAKQVEAFKLLQANIRDTNGQLLPFPEILVKVRQGLSGLSQVDKDVVTTALFGRDAGAKGIRSALAATEDQANRLGTALDNSAGIATKSGEALNTGLGGGLRLLDGSVGATSAKFGEFVSVGLIPVVQGATLLLNTFLAFPAPLQVLLIGATGLVGILAAAVAAVIAFELANGKAILKVAGQSAALVIDTIATNGNAAAKLLAAAATGTLTEAQEASIASFVKGAATAGLFAGAIAAIGLAVDTFNKVEAAANATRASIDDFNKSLEKLDEANLKANDSATKKAAAADIETQANKRIQDSIGGVQQALDVLRKVIDFFSIRHLLEEFAKLDVVPQPIKDLVNGIVNFLPKVATAAEAAATNAKVAFSDVLDSADKVEARFQKLDLGTASKEQIDALNGSIAASIAAIEKAAPADAADVQGKQLRIDRLKELQKQLAATGKAEVDNTPGKTIGGGDAKPDTKALEKEAKDEAAKEGEVLKQQRQDDKTREEAAFADSQREKQEKEQEKIAQADREYQKAKEGRAEAFQDKQAVIDKQYQKSKEERAATFQDQQAAIDRQNQAEKQTREAEFADAQRKIEDDRKEAQRKRGEAQSQTQGEAGRLLTGEVARGKDLRKLREDQFQRDSVGKLTDEDLLGKDGKALSPQELAALAKRSAGLGPGQLQGKDSEEAAQNALKLITERQNKALKEQEKKEDEAAAKKKREDDLKFKLAQEKIDEQKAKLKKEDERKEKDAVEKEDERKAKEKKGREKEEKKTEEGLDLQHNEAKKNDARNFAKELRDAERDFKDKQRDLDRDNARQIKDIIESAKVKAPEPNTPPKNVGSNPIGDINYVPTPRFLGGSVVPGVTYLGGERGPERLHFGDGQDTVVGDRGPQLFRVQRSGYVHPHDSPFTQSYLNVVQAGFSGQQRSPSVNVQTNPVGFSDGAIVQELVALRREVQGMRPINQSYQIETRNPMDEVYRATKMAARLRR